jgi:sugar lactone lactonase YvrE
LKLEADILFDGLGVPESLRWHDGALWFCDLVRGGGVYRATPGQDPERIVEVPGRAGGLGWLPDGRMLVVSMDQRCVYRLEPNGALVPHAALGEIAGGDANDMVVDATGRAYVGNFGFDYHAAVKNRPAAMLYAPPGPPRAPVAAFAPDGSLVGTTGPLYFPNGAVVFDDGRTLVVSETMAMRLTAFTVAEDGSLTNPRPWAPLIAKPLWRALNAGGLLGRATRRVSALTDRPWVANRSSSPIAPDGIALHADGATIWVANALRGECVRVAEGGQVLDRVKTSQLTLSCVVGGEDGRTLYAATAPLLDPEEARAARRGRIEAVQLPASVADAVQVSPRGPTARAVT